jgi:hypothetical protein
MAYNFLGLVNEVNRRLNEVELTTANFANAKGFYSQAKDAVNSAIKDIHQSQIEWPFNHVEQEETLTAGETRYSFPADANSVDMDSFRIKKDSTLNNATEKLRIISYEEYLEKFVDQEYTADTSVRSVPEYVFRAPSMEYGVVPCPDQAYEIVYEYYRNNVDLVNATDVSVIPEIYKHVIIDGAMYYAYLFRGNSQDALIMDAKFKQGIKNMRTILINRYDYVRSTALISRVLKSNYVYRLR